MSVKRTFQLIMVAAILVTTFASAGAAVAWSGCASSITVQWGDTLSGLARLCGTTVEAIQAANPGLGLVGVRGTGVVHPDGVYARSSCLLPNSSGSTYVVQSGDTLAKIAARYGSQRERYSGCQPADLECKLDLRRSMHQPAGCPCLLHGEQG